MRKLSMEELNRISSSEFKEMEKNKVIVILDNIRSMNNIGSVFRTADAFKLEAIYLCGITATPPHREIQKTALGATESVHWEYFESTTVAIEKVKKHVGGKVYAIEQVTGSISLQHFTPGSEPMALIFGNEVNGVSEEVLPLCDGCIEIPQFGTKHSFNVSVTAGIVLWDILSKAGKL